MGQNVAKWVAETSEKANFMSCKMNWVAETSEKANFMSFGNFQKGKFQVNLNKGLCLLFQAEPQMKRRVCNEDAIKGQAPNQNVLSIQASVSVQVSVLFFKLSGLDCLYCMKSMQGLDCLYYMKPMQG